MSFEANRPLRSGATILSQAMVFVLGTCLVAWIGYRMLYRPAARGYPVTSTAADSIPWKTDLEAALAESGKTGKRVLVDFSASWCPPCQEMKHNAWPDVQVGRIVSERYIPVLMDPDRPESAAPSQRYGIQLIPAILILDSKGNVIRQGQYMSRDELVEFLSQGGKAG